MVIKWIGYLVGFRRLVLRIFRRIFKYFWIYKIVCWFVYCKNMYFFCSMLLKNWIFEMFLVESGELLNRKFSFCFSWSILILLFIRSFGREGMVCCISLWVFAKEVICIESLRSRRGSFCLRVRWWSGLFRLLWFCRYCLDLSYFFCFKMTGMVSGF